MKALLPLRRRVRPADLLCAGVLLALLALSVPPPSAAPWLPLEYAALLAGGIALAALDGPGRPLATVHAFYPVLVIALMFDSLRFLIPHVNPSDLTPSLIEADRWLFGVHPTVLLERLTTPILNDFMHLAYLSYYPLPFLLVIRLWRKGEDAAFDQAAFSLALVYFASYIGYLLVPALGPDHSLAGKQTFPLEGWITPAIRAGIAYLEGIKFDAFPSGHTAVALAVVWLAASLDRRFLPGAALAATALILSTVYTRYHHVVDVLAGLPLGAAGALLGPPCARVLRRALGREKMSPAPPR